jgi:parallel beta-helix repeat protein
MLSLLSLCLRVESGKALPKTLFVPDDYSSIQGAINAASPGDTVYVRGGTYDGNIVVNKTISLIGEDRTATIRGAGSASGMGISADSVTVSGFTILATDGQFGGYRGIWLGGNFDTFIGNTVTNTTGGIDVGGGNNTIVGNIFIQNWRSIEFIGSCNASIVSNIFEGNGNGITLTRLGPRVSDNNTIAYNRFANDGGIESVFGLGRSIITYNTFNYSSINLQLHDLAYVNTIHHNNFMYSSLLGSAADLDDGYPSGGNFWSYYNGVDNFSGPFQNLTGSDGIGDTSYSVWDNTDRYPLMNPVSQTHDIAVTKVTAIKSIVGQGYKSLMEVTVENQADLAETFEITAYINSMMAQAKNVTVLGRASSTVQLTWNSYETPKGSYSITVHAYPVLGETDISDNTLTEGVVTVVMPGDISGPSGIPDDKVDIRDLAAIAIIYGVNSTNPRYNANCDINSDRKIDIKDLAIAAKNYGKTDP